MERIGFAASKMAKGRVVLYNFYVILFTTLLALFMFLIAGAPIMLALLIIGLIVNGILPYDFGQDWRAVMILCMTALTIVVSLLAIAALIRNLKFRSSKLPDGD
ncbi:MAG: hypothetical protein ACLFPX_04255 [Candidatus Omnitrophota bacterium]